MSFILSRLRDIVVDDQLWTFDHDRVPGIEFEDVGNIVVIIVQKESQAELRTPHLVDVGIGSFVEHGPVPARMQLVPELTNLVPI